MTEENLTEWDSSKATLYRIDNLLKKCAEASFYNDYSSWYRYLQSLKREAIVKMKPDAKKICEDKFDKLSNNVTVYERARHKSGASSQLMKSLDEAETHLRDFMNSKGMLMKDANTALQRFKGG